MTFRKRGGLGGISRPDVNGPRPASDVGDEARGAFDHARCSNRHENRAFVECAENPVQIERHFSKPADVRPNPAAAFASWKLGLRIIGARVVKWWTAARTATALE